MNYFLGLLLIAICGGAYYEHTTSQQKITDLQKQYDEQVAKSTDLESAVQTLTREKDSLTASLKEAKDKLGGTPVASTGAPLPPGILTMPASANPAPAATPPAPATGAAPVAPPAAKTLNSDEISRSVVLIKGDRAEGTGFLVKTADGPAIITNLHVLANNPNVKIMTKNGATVITTGFKGAQDRDLAMLTIQDAGFTYLPLATDLNTVQAGDEVLTPGNSQGGNVILNTTGKVVAVGPDRIEFDNPIYHGNSGGPVFHTKSGTVLGVVTEAMKVDLGNALDKASFASRNSAISGSMRYFGLRLDTVPKWELYDTNRFLMQTIFLDRFHQQSLRLDSYLNPPKSGQPGDQAASTDTNTKLYLNDPKIMKANDAFVSRINGGGDTSSQIDILRQFAFDLSSIADQDMTPIQDPGNFYTYMQVLARDELAYRRALKTEIESFGNDVTRIGGLVRKN